MRAYATQSRRGFSNEITVHVFGSRAKRDAWVAAHKDDGDVNSTACGAKTVSAKEAHQIMRYKGDAVTTSYNTVVEHD